MEDKVLNTSLTETTLLILLTFFKENHGYGCGQEVEAMTKGRVVLGPGTLYGALGNLEEKGWIVQKGVEGRRRYYQITHEGSQQVYKEMLRLRELLAMTEKVWEEQL